LHFLTALLFERIGASEGEDSEENRKEGRTGFHPLILGMIVAKSNERCSGAYAPASAAY
jgi:hypothetical protein